MKLFLTGLGWAFGGPLGGIIGYAIGALFSGNGPRVIRSEVTDTFGNTEEKRDFNVTLLVLSAAVMKADGSNVDFLLKKIAVVTNAKISEVLFDHLHQGHCHHTHHRMKPEL